jgi:hypothetical protein
MLTEMRAHILLLLPVVACGGAEPAAPPIAPGGASAEAAPSSADTAPSANVVGIGVSDKEDKFTRVTVAFKNPTRTTCKIPTYTLTWAGGSKQIALPNFELGPGQTQTRAVRVHASDGDITSLTTPEQTRVEIAPQCAGR